MNKDNVWDSSLTETDFNRTNDFNTTKNANDLVASNNLIFEDPIREQDVTNYESK